MEIYTSYYQNKQLLQYNSVYLIGISSSRPRFYAKKSDEFWQFLGTTDEMRAHGLNDEEYENQILIPQRDLILQKFSEIPKNFESVIFLCFEKNVHDCHRYIFGFWLGEQLGVDVYEF